MNQRRRFWMRSIVRGWMEVVALKDHLEIATILVVAVAALVGITTLGLSIPLWIHATGIVLAILAVVILDGAFLEWEALQKTSPQDLNEIDRIIADLEVERVGTGSSRDN